MVIPELEDGSENYSGPKAKGKCKIGANAILHLILFHSVCVCLEYGSTRKKQENPSSFSSVFPGDDIIPYKKL